MTFFLRVLPTATIVCGLIITLLWVAVLGFALCKLTALALSLA